MSPRVCCSDAIVVEPDVANAGETSLASSVPALDGSAATGSLGWSSAHSSILYGIDKWGGPYFTVNAAGNISIHPYGTRTKDNQMIDLLQVVKKVTGPISSGGKGVLKPPLIIRFPHVLQHQLDALQSAFDHAIASRGYRSHYRGVFPVKSNQDRQVVEDIAEFGFGLEAGSKPELLLCMSVMCSSKSSPEALLICNGFKDPEYISLALTARKVLDLNAVIVLEQEEELDAVLELSERLSIVCVIGLRAKLKTRHSGHFGSSSGENAKFGLTVTQILRIVEKLADKGMLHCLRLLHFHMGSQIPSIRSLTDAAKEAAQIYCELFHLGAEKMEIIDIGGGLGIDYDGSRSNSESSVEYGLDEYASAVVEAIRSTCDAKMVKHPVICSESGRAIVSHHSILVFEAVAANVERTPDEPSLQDLQESLDGALTDKARAEYENLVAMAGADYHTCSAHARQLKLLCANQFRDGSLSIKQLAAIDGICEFYLKMFAEYDPVRVFNINLSIFASFLDSWGISQVFPVLPIHRLDERPTAKGILHDLTCDSDGKIDKFIGGRSSLPLHDPACSVCGGGKYYLGMFLGGAYQEALGGLHNLFGRPNAVRILANTDADETQGFVVDNVVDGMSCADVLKAMQYERDRMLQTLADRDVDGTATAILERAFGNMPYLVTGNAIEIGADEVMDVV